MKTRGGNARTRRASWWRAATGPRSRGWSQIVVVGVHFSSAVIPSVSHLMISSAQFFVIDGSAQLPKTVYSCRDRGSVYRCRCSTVYSCRDRGSAQLPKKICGPQFRFFVPAVSFFRGDSGGWGKGKIGGLCDQGSLGRIWSLITQCAAFGSW